RQHEQPAEFASVIRLYRFRFSTNVERVTLALAYKGLDVESVWVDPDDRSPVEQVSGQPLVPVIADEERVVFDSTAILSYLEQHYPEPPLYPREEAQRAAMDVYIDWFIASVSGRRTRSRRSC